MASLVRPRYACETSQTQFSKTLELLGKQTAKEYQNIAVVRAEKFLQVGHVKSTVQYLSHLAFV